MKRQSVVLIAVAACLGFGAGIVLQRLYPVGKILADVGLRDLVPVPRKQEETNLPSRDWDIPPEDRGHLALFVLMGQSNMSGRGSVSSPNTPDPHPSVYAFNKDYRWYPAREPLGTVPNEVNAVATDGGTGVGPGLAFARALVASNPALKIGLVPCARGASSIHEWQPDLGQNSLYGACLRQVRAASTYGRVAAVLFSQGESDADVADSGSDRVLVAKGWAREFTEIAKRFREDTGEGDLPILYAQLGTNPNPSALPNWEVVKQEQASIVLPRAVMIKTDDLPLRPDGHFETEAQVEIGKRFAAAYCSLLGKHP